MHFGHVAPLFPNSQHPSSVNGAAAWAMSALAASEGAQRSGSGTEIRNGSAPPPASGSSGGIAAPACISQLAALHNLA